MDSRKMRKHRRSPPPGFMAVKGGAGPARLAGELRSLEEKRRREAEAGDVPEKDAPAESELVGKLTAERDEFLAIARRERAELENYRKRVQREMRHMKRESLAEFLKDFFQPLADLERVIEESGKKQSYETLAGGVRILADSFWRTLAKAGVKRTNPKGKQFDPAQHDAMAAVPSADVPPNTIIDVFENGYTLDEFVLKPARVVVSRAPD